MRPRVSVFIATSLDGFIARPDGALDWLPSPIEGGEDYGYAAFMADVDLLVMGRHTFETVLSFGAWTYGERHVLVLASRPPAVPNVLRDRVTTACGAPERLVAEEPFASANHVYLDGGETIRRFLAADLVDDLTLTRVPVLLGAGRPLFGALAEDRRWTHAATRSWPDGLVQSTYHRA